MDEKACTSWRIRGGRIVRCSWPRTHVKTSKWHCAESTTGHIWLVGDNERIKKTFPDTPSLGTPCSDCDHSLNWHKVRCTVRGCDCSQFLS